MSAPAPTLPTLPSLAQHRRWLWRSLTVEVRVYLRAMYRTDCGGRPLTRFRSPSLRESMRDYARSRNSGALRVLTDPRAPR